MEKIKDYFKTSLGVIGYILYLLLAAFVSFMPVLMFDLPLWAYFLICTLITFVLGHIPAFTELSWLIGLVGAINGKQDIWAIIYYIACAIIVGTFIYKFIKGFNE